VEAFYDPLNISKREHDKDGEWRWQTFGVVSGFDLLMVAHTVAEESVEGVLIEAVGIISARYADRHERSQYEDENS